MATVMKLSEAEVLMRECMKVALSALKETGETNFDPKHLGKESQAILAQSAMIFGNTLFAYYLNSGEKPEDLTKTKKKQK